VPGRAEPRALASALRRPEQGYCGVLLSRRGAPLCMLRCRVRARAAAAQGCANELLQLYAVHLLDSGQPALLPPYACHLRAGARADVFALHLRLLNAAAAPDACLAAFEEASAWFGAWGAAGRGDVAPNEMALLVEQARAQLPAVLRLRPQPAEPPAHHHRMRC